LNIMSFSIIHSTPKVEYFLNKQIAVISYPCTYHYECTPYEVRLKRGSYYLEVYGAQGSNSTGPNEFYPGGKGGYSSGIYTTRNDMTIYLYVGASTNSSISFQASFNGGGRGLNNRDGPGGGATDFRTVRGSDNTSLSSRIIVAGGGGGAFREGGRGVKGGDGGGINGGQGVSFRGGAIPCYATQYGVEGGNQVSGLSFFYGTFGYGSGGYYGGGGGGYFGGCNTASSGSGGSGYIGGVYGIQLYKKQTISGQNSGLGWAVITAIKEAFSCHVALRIPSTSLIYILMFYSTE
jgi:hypothetical protein